MPHTLGIYNPYFYAQEALIALKKALGLAPRIHRGYDRTEREKGDTILIRVPSTFTVEDAPSTAQDLTTSNISITLDYWKEVKFGLTDKDLSLSIPQLVTDHIEPAAYALADYIDQILAGLYVKCPWSVTASSPAAVADITSLRSRMFNNLVPLQDPNRHCMLDGTLTSELLNLQAFSQYQGAGETGAQTQISGDLGVRYGFRFFENQNVKTHTAGAITASAAKVKTTVAAGLSAIVVYDTTLTGTVKIGDIFAIAGHSQQYTVTANATASGNEVAVALYPPLTDEATADDAITFSQTSGTVNLAFHKNFAALAMAPLSTMGQELGGVRMATVFDETTQLALRSRMFYVGNESKTYVSLDVLFGVAVLRPNLAVRYLNTA